MHFRWAEAFEEGEGFWGLASGPMRELVSGPWIFATLNWFPGIGSLRLAGELGGWVPEPGLVSGLAAELVSELGCSTAEELELGFGSWNLGGRGKRLR